MPGRWRLIVVWGLFAAWVGWLGWQALRDREFPVVSRAQLLNADAVVAIEVATDREGRALTSGKLVEIAWTNHGTQNLILEKDISLPNLPGCVGFKEPGIYLVPLQGKGPYKVAEMSRSPLVDSGRFKPQIYAARPEVRRQIQQYYEGQ